MFLRSLDLATRFREAHLGIVALLPLAGFAIGWVYERFGRSVEAGNQLIVDEIHDPRAVIPLRMAPLVYLGTVATHLFGGSAGREGTAIQMGASIADQLTGRLRLGEEGRRILLMTGVSAGFGSVFGTPVAGTVFGLEIYRTGRPRLASALSCLLGAWVAHAVALAWGVSHTEYRIGAGSVPGWSLPSLLWAALAGLAFGAAARLFVGATHLLAAGFRRRVARAPLRPLIGGVGIAAAAWALGSSRYLGLGIPTIVESFTGRVPPWDFALKAAFTAWTLGSGFKGGEATPLFFIGATLGNALARLLPLPSALLSGMGFVAVFGAAARTPIACSVMALELFGAGPAAHAAVACFAACAVWRDGPAIFGFRPAGSRLS